MATEGREISEEAEIRDCEGMLYTSNQELTQACPKAAAVVMGTLKRLVAMQEGQDLVTDSYESEEGGHAEDHVKGCAMGEWRYHLTGKVRKWRG